MGQEGGTQDQQVSSAPRVVLDTNVVLSTLVFAQGRVAALRRGWHDGRCRPIVSPATVGELMRALAYPKFKLTTDEQGELLADYLPYCTTVLMSDNHRRAVVPQARTAMTSRKKSD